MDEEKYWLIFYSYLPVNVPVDKMVAAAEFVTRANRGMRIGNFELDYDDGEVRYKTSLDVEGGELSSKMIDNLLRANLSTTNRYFAGLDGTHLQRQVGRRHRPPDRDPARRELRPRRPRRGRRRRGRGERPYAPDEDEDEDGNRRF